MLTEFGKALRKIRIERQEVLKEMADKLHISSAYLSAVETGKRRIPNGWVQIISERYNLGAEEKDKLQQAADDSALDITISLEGASQAKRDMVLSFARALDGLNDDDLERIMSTMKKMKKRGK